jgi:virulence factor
MTETLEQAEAVVRAAAESDLVVQVGHIERFNPTYMELKKVLEEMSLLAVNFKRLSPYQTSNTDVDVILDLMIHDIDLAHDLIGDEPVTISAQGLTTFSGKADHVVAQMGFENGPIVTMTASRVTEQKVRTIEVTCREAFIEADLLNKSISVHRRSFGEYLNHNKAGVKYRQESIVERILVPSVEPLLLELGHFIEAVQDKTPTNVPPQAGFSALRSAERICGAICDNLVEISEHQTTPAERETANVAQTA